VSKNALQSSFSRRDGYPSPGKFRRRLKAYVFALGFAAQDAGQAARAFCVGLSGVALCEAWSNERSEWAAKL